jgi:hypothetical protein
MCCIILCTVATCSFFKVSIDWMLKLHGFKIEVFGLTCIMPKYFYAVFHGNFVVTELNRFTFIDININMSFAVSDFEIINYTISCDFSQSTPGPKLWPKINVPSAQICKFYFNKWSNSRSLIRNITVPRMLPC